MSTYAFGLGSCVGGDGDYFYDWRMESQLHLEESSDCSDDHR